METLKNIFQNVMDGDSGATEENVRAALEGGTSAEEILNEGLIAAMDKVGALFEEGEYFVPEMLIAAKAMKAGMQILKPYLVEAGVETTGKVVLGTVKGDMHDIGKNLVAMMLEGAGFEIIDLGTDVTPERFVEAAREGADIVGLSGLLTTTMPGMEDTIQAFEAAGLRGQVKILVGGAPVTSEYAKKIGADGYAPDASQAVALVKSLVA